MLKELEPPFIVDGFLGQENIAKMIGQITFAHSNRQIRPQETIEVDGNVVATLMRMLSSTNDISATAAARISLPAAVMRGSVPWHCDRHVLEADQPRSQGKTGVIYLTHGGFLEFEEGSRVEAKPGRLVVFDSARRHRFCSNGQPRALIGPVAVRASRLQADPAPRATHTHAPHTH